MAAKMHLIIILGGPASGKTTLAGHLAAELGWACLCKDDVKEALFDVLGIGDREHSRRLSEASFAALIRLAAAQVGARMSCILEGNWRPAHEAALSGLLESSGAQAAQVVCRADAATIATRFAARRRHPGHLDGSALGEELRVDAARPVEFLELPGPRWNYDSDRPKAAEAALVGNLRAWCGPIRL